MPNTERVDETAQPEPSHTSHPKQAHENNLDSHSQSEQAANKDGGSRAGSRKGNYMDGRTGDRTGNYMGLRRARKYGLPINGWIILDKPIGLRSTAAVAKVQSLLRARKCGHAGTLDPAAEGLLPLALGMATKTVSYAMDGTKDYDIVVRWGERSNTDDSEGEIEETSSSRPSFEQIEAMLGKFTGTIEQRPPSFSALRIEGKRAYDLARKGEKVILDARPVVIESLKLVKVIDKNLARFSVESGKGAYMRALARDLGEALGCLGRLESLRRRRVGAFYEKHAISLDELEKIVHSENEEELSREKVIEKLGNNLLPIEAVLAEMPKLMLEKDEQRKFLQGQGLLFISSPQRERIAHIKEEQHIATFVDNQYSDAVSYSLPKLLGIGSLVKGRFKAQRLFVETGGKTKNASHGNTSRKNNNPRGTGHRNTRRGHDSHGDTRHRDTRHGNTRRGHDSHGNANHGNDSYQDTSHGNASHGNASHEDTRRGHDSQKGDSQKDASPENTSPKSTSQRSVNPLYTKSLEQNHNPTDEIKNTQPDE